MKVLKKLAGAVAVLGLTLAVAACGSTTDGENMSSHKSMAKADIVDTAVSAGKFTTLVAAVKAAGLVDTLKGPGPFTVFAPTDAAFDALPSGTVETLLKPENKDQLVAILTYHVVAGKVMSADIAGKAAMVPSLQGSNLDVNATGANVMINTAKVVAADVETSNGVIHIIDTVLLPK